jgi:hypothetical protein
VGMDAGYAKASSNRIQTESIEPIGAWKRKCFQKLKTKSLA